MIIYFGAPCGKLIKWGAKERAEEGYISGKVWKILKGRRNAIPIFPFFNDSIKLPNNCLWRDLTCRVLAGYSTYHNANGGWKKKISDRMIGPPNDSFSEAETLKCRNFQCVRSWLLSKLTHCPWPKFQPLARTFFPSFYNRIESVPGSPRLVNISISVNKQYRRALNAIQILLNRSRKAGRTRKTISRGWLIAIIYIYVYI